MNGNALLCVEQALAYQRHNDSHKTDILSANHLSVPQTAKNDNDLAYPINAERCVQHLLSERLRLSA